MRPESLMWPLMFSDGRGLAGLADSDPPGVEVTELNPKSGLRSLLLPPPPPGGPGEAEGRLRDIILDLRSSVMAADPARADEWLRRGILHLGMYMVQFHHRDITSQGIFV